MSAGAGRLVRNDFWRGAPIWMVSLKSRGAVLVSSKRSGSRSWPVRTFRRLGPRPRTRRRRLAADRGPAGVICSRPPGPSGNWGSLAAARMFDLSFAEAFYRRAT